MAVQWAVHIILALVSVIPVAQAKNGADLKDLHDELFNKRSYPKFIIPRADVNKPIIISVAFYLHGINYLDEVEGKLVTTAHLELGWNDTFLTWDRRDFSNISYFYMPQSEDWRPDVSLYNGFTKLKELGDDVILVKVYYDGRMEWNPFEVFETKCDIAIKRFPFDCQKCKLVLRMWTSGAEDVKFGLRDSVLNMVSFEPNGVWDLRSSKIELDRGNAIVSLELDRRPEHYLLTLICPILLLSFLSIFTFVIPVDSGEKMGYSMTVYLAFAVFLTIVSSSLPVNSRAMSYMAVYLIGLLEKGTSIVIVTAAQVRLHHRQSNVDLPPSLRRVINISRGMYICSGRRVKPNRIDVTKKTSSKNDKSDNSVPFYRNVIAVKECPDTRLSSDASSEYEDNVDEMFTWADFSTALDSFLFCFFFTVAVVLTVVFFTAAL
ncbi:acetylcholine receptor subunit alpha-like [Mizuhopecten yessoensis]|uniref:Acetylcholine receptor subunit alpha n=1 Tax=Mizuhopecten yessoensis TaxID=6573 RepID=A0A210PMV0_MIZYE|nr:acetylcholine receptor subunit alpha-like [Mizuhopecten yessoensis]OWF37793.1 Acetylcholine receptor subunit alpha [Mizuhopecten yessoensis]